MCWLSNRSGASPISGNQSTKPPTFPHAAWIMTHITKNSLQQCSRDRSDNNVPKQLGQKRFGKARGIDDLRQQLGGYLTSQVLSNLVMVPYLLRDDQNLRNNCVTVQWRRRGRRASLCRPAMTCECRYPGLRSPR